MSDRTHLFQRDAKALLLFCCRPYDDVLSTHVALRVEPGSARWEASDGNALLFLAAMPGDLGPGLYLTPKACVARCAGIPAKLRDSDDDAVPVESAEGRGWPDVPAMLAADKGAGAVSHSFRGFGLIQIKRMAALSAIYRGPSPFSGEHWNVRFGGDARSAMIWELSVASGVQVLLMPCLTTGEPEPVLGQPRRAT